MGQKEAEALDAIREAMRDPHVAIHLVPTFTHGRAVQVKIRSRKIGPLIIPKERPLSDILTMLGEMADE